MAATSDPELFRGMERDAGALRARESRLLTRLIAAAVRIKAAVVSADERESGLREVLNFGHTIGHGLENASGYLLAHGAAVAVGMIAESRMARRAGFLKPAAEDRLHSLIGSLGLPLRAPDGVERGNVLAAMRSDKKARGGTPRLRGARGHRAGPGSGRAGTHGVLLSPAHGGRGRGAPRDRALIEIAPGPAPLDAAVRVPGSKYEANRFLIAAALTEGTTRLRGLPEGEDIRAAISAVDALGGRAARRGDLLEIEGVSASAGAGSSREAAKPRAVSVGESGTLLRFLTAAAATVPAPIVITGTGRIPKRPVAGLVTALATLGADIETTDGGAPLTVRSGRLNGGATRVDATESSQFGSALLLAAPRAAGAVVIELEGAPVSASYLDLTVSVMARCGVDVERSRPGRFRVAAGARYRPGDHRISGDWTSAGYFFAAAALAPGRVTVDGLDPESPQGERGFAGLLRRMGCEVVEEAAEDGVRMTVTGASRLHGISVDMRSMPDAVPTLAAIAPFAEGPTVIRGTAHLRHKESDRIAALADGLGRLGARVVVTDDGLGIEPAESGPALRAAALDPHGDHRIAMALALTGLRLPGVRVRSPRVVAKSFPGFWEALSRLGARVSSRETA